MSDAPISLIVLEPVIDSMAALVRVLEKSPQVELIAVPSAEEAHQVALQFQPCVMLLSIRGSLDGNTQVELLKKLEKPIRSGLVKPLVISTVKKHPLAVAISTIGVKDYVEEPTTTKSLLFKMNLFFKAINAQKAKNSKNKNEETTVFKAKPQEEQKDSLVVSTKLNAKYKPALQLAEDTFVFKGSLPRKVNNKLMLEAEGPSPETGTWNELPTKSGELQKWKWVPNPTVEEDGNNPQEEDSGWVYEGDKPSYNVLTGKWQMQSLKPRLDFYKKAKPVANKVETDDHGEVSIAEDSQAAKDNLMLNKTLVSQAQEEQLKKAILEQEEEEIRKIMVVEKRIPPKQRARSGTLRENAEEDDEARSELEKKKREKKTAERNKASSEEEGDAPIEWSSKISSDLPESGLLKNSLSNRGAGKARELNHKEAGDSNDLPSASNLELKTKEEKLDGLKEDDLTGEQNLRDKMRDEFSLSLNPEEEAEGLNEEQLNGKMNRKEKLRSIGALNEGEEDDAAIKSDLADLDKNHPESRHSKRQKKELGAHKPRREKLSKEKLEKLAKEKIQAILALMAVEEGEDLKISEVELPDDEQVNRLRKQLNIADDESLTRQELERRAREQKKKHRQEEIKALEDAISGGITSLESIFFTDEPDDWNEEDLSVTERERNFRAIESADEDLYEEDSTLAKLKKKQKEAKNKSASNSEYFYLAQEEVQPEGGKWICEEENWIYLSAHIFNSGFERLEDLLPTWIYRSQR